MNNVIPNWFRVTVVDGLQRLMALSLQGHPASETIKATAKAWTDAIWSAPIAWQQDIDQWRIEAAFLKLSRSVDRWPSPFAVIQSLPKRKQPLLVAAPKLSEQQRLANKNRLKQMLKALK